MASLLADCFIEGEVLDALDPLKEWRVVIGDDGEVIGAATWHRRCGCYRAWQLDWIAVSSEARNQGVGRLLLDRLKAEVISNDGATIVVETPCDSPARGFYEACGFQLAGVVPEFYEAGRGTCVYYWTQ
ncbi:MAG: N-acetyltransferase [Bacteroidetes bacterium]|nr:MAG: N-acetyltransferase [Bacteroidota bacterium]